MSYQGKKVIGVWLNNKNAFIIGTADRKIGSEFSLLKKIDRTNHDDEHYKNERFELAKEKQELKVFYKAISEEIDSVEVIFIFGPGKAQEELKNVLKDMPKFKTKIIEMGTSDKISTHQMIARVKEHFEGKPENVDN
jgi:predicted nuclease with TOPRIM domain